MKSSKSAVRYAKALLELATDQGKLEVVEKNMAYIVATAKETRDFQIFLNSPVIRSDKKIAIIGEIFGFFDQLTLSFLGLVTKNSREYLILAIAESFAAQLKAQKGIVPISITSAKILDATTRTKIVDKLKNTVSGTIELTEIIDEKLIGGFIVRMGDHQIDASVATQLTRLKQALTK
jgi:F-type H+-transporting ATPase subunit delta